MNITLIQDQMAYIELALETEDEFEVYGGTTRAPFEFQPTGVASWRVVVRESEVAGAAIRPFDVYARQRSSGREWVVLSGRIFVKPRTADIEGDKLSPVEYHVTVPVVDSVLETQGMAIVTGIPGPQGPQGEKGEPGEGGMTDEERATLAGAAQRDGDNTFTAANTFTGSVDMSNASVTPPSGWNVEGVTAEAIQAVAPIAWSSDNAGVISGYANSISLGSGGSTKTSNQGTTALGYKTQANMYSTALGYRCESLADHSYALGCHVVVSSPAAIGLGASYSDTAGSYTCTTEGTGSITIGAGANTLNTTQVVNGKETTVESSNSVTIGCKALNQGADSVVIGAQASNPQAASVVIGAGAVDNTSLGKSIAIGKGAKSEGYQGSTTIGYDSSGGYYGTSVGFFASSANSSTALGSQAKATNGAVSVGAGASARGFCSMAFGYNNILADNGTISFLTSDDFNNPTAKTKLYIVGANTPLANEYYNGEAFMGYTVTDKDGNKLACGTRRLSELFPDNSLTQPASLDENGEWVMPKVFHPSDLDMPQEEPSEVEEYKPLPVYPIVEPSEDELRTPTDED